MKVWFSGAEVPKHRELLGRAGVDRVAINLAPVVKDRSGGLGNDESLLAFEKVFYSSQADLEPSDYAPVLDRYVDEDSWVLGLDHRPSQTAGKWVPEWHGGDVEEALEWVEEYGALAVAEGVLNTPQLIRPIVLFVHKNPHVRLFSVTSKVKLIAPLFATDVIVSGWLSAQRQRELQVWDGNKVARSPRSSRQEQVETHRAQISNLGRDVTLIREGDVAENTMLAIVSWLQYEQIATTPGSILLPGVGDPDLAHLAIDSPTKRENMQLLPVLTASESGDSVAVSSSSLRQCDVCSLNMVCPKYEAHSTCGFAIPVTLRTKTDLGNMMSALLEMQGQRVLMAKFTEDLLSQGNTAEASAEIDRFFRLLESMKRITEDRQTLSVTASSTGGADGVLTSLFGAHVGQANRQLPTPVDSDDVIEDADIIDD